MVNISPGAEGAERENGHTGTWAHAAWVRGWAERYGRAEPSGGQHGSPGRKENPPRKWIRGRDHRKGSWVYREPGQRRPRQGREKDLTGAAERQRCAALGAFRCIRCRLVMNPFSCRAVRPVNNATF